MITQSVKCTLPINIDNIKKAINELPELIYSYYIGYIGNNHYNILLKINYHEDDVYNTVNKQHILNSMIILQDKKVMDKPEYEQPSADIMLEVYQPYIRTLAKTMSDSWQHIDYEDLVQMCSLVLVQLSNKGLYIHKGLLRKAFYNYVNVYLRHNYYNPKKFSFESFVNKSASTIDDKDITYADTLVDQELENEKQDTEQKELVQDIFVYVVKLLEHVMSKRECDQFIKDYMNGHTNCWSRRKMSAVKKFMENNGITWNKLLNERN